MNSSLFQALGIIDCGIMRYLGHRRFEIVFSKDDWFEQLLPESVNNAQFELTDNCAFLSDFLLDAEEFWQKHSAGQIHSGIWTEHIGKLALHLEAIAAYSSGEKFIVINNVYHEFKAQQKTLQVARELLLTNDKMLSQHQYMNDRLSSVLSQNASLLELNLPIQQAIESASISVIITDKDNKEVSTNKAAWDLFEMQPDSADRPPINIFKELFEKQFPESERILANHSPWSGELYWHCPPNYNKWIQAEMQPIFDAQRQFKHWVVTLSDVTRIKYLLQNNENLALHDSLTGLPNRQYFWQTIEQHIGSGKHFYVMYMDIKQFKDINELHGHLTGDSLLIAASKRIKKLLQKEDFMARIGADEFAVILCKNRYDNQQQEGESKDLFDQCAELATLIREESQRAYYTERDERCALPMCIGIASHPQDASQSEALMKAADLAVHAAKLFAQDPIQFYSKDLKDASEARLLMESRLRDAIANEELEIYLQPILDLASGKVVKAEALLRWFPDNYSVVGPDVFIPVAEQSGLIYPLGKWVITKVCEILAQFRRNNVNIKLSLNLSPHQVSDHRLFEFIKSTAERLGIDASKLELELTEGVLVDNYEKARKLLSSLRDMGVTIAIDDFGTGYSSLAYLKNLPIDHLKIDRSFVQDLDKDEDDRAIVLAILAMADQLKLSVIAEGVETQAQCDFLKLHNCASAQGFLYGRPMPVDEFFKHLDHKP